MTPEEARRLPLYRHVKTGGIYAERGRGKMEATLEPVVIYENVNAEEIWVRPAAEFDDGRFKRVFTTGVETSGPISRELP
jgi:hypothetical protein